MSLKKKLNVLIINDSILNNTSGDTYSSFLISNLNNLNYAIGRIVTIPNIIRIIAQELSFSNKEYDITLIITNLSSGSLYQILAKLFGQDTKRNEALEKILKAKNIAFKDEELLTPRHICIAECEKYPLLHLQRIFIINEKYMDSIFHSTLKKILMYYRKPAKLQKIANVYLNGNSGEINNIECDSVKFQLTKSSENTVQITYESEFLEDLIQFEDDLRRLVFISSSKPVLHNAIYSDENFHIKNAIKVIETCFERYSPENTFISFNGGKDCTVLLHIMLSVLEKCCPCHSQKPLCLYVQGNEPFPEQEEFIEQCEQFYGLEIVQLQMEIKEALRVTLRDHPNLKACLMGTRSTDPFSESLSEFQMTDKGYPEVMRVNPLINWRYFHIWDYLLYYKIPYCKLYDEGYTSLGGFNNTAKNSDLLYKDILSGEEHYLPAYKLLLDQNERSGRNR